MRARIMSSYRNLMVSVLCIHTMRGEALTCLSSSTSVDPHYLDVPPMCRPRGSRVYQPDILPSEIRESPHFHVIRTNERADTDIHSSSLQQFEREKGYNYNVPIPQPDAEDTADIQALGDCSICLEPVAPPHSEKDATNLSYATGLSQQYSLAPCGHRFHPVSLLSPCCVWSEWS